MFNKQLNSNNIDLRNNTSLYEFSKTIQNFDKINIKEIGPTTKNINEYTYEGDLCSLIDDLVNLIFKESNKGKDNEPLKQYVINYINGHKIALQEIYDWLLNNQINSNCTYMLGYLNYYGVGTEYDKQKAIELFKKAAELENSVAQLGLIDIYILEKDPNTNYNLAFELSKKLAEKGYACGIKNLGYCYINGIGTNINKQKAFELYQKAADSGSSDGINNLGWCHEKGIGTDINKQKAFELYQKAADLGNLDGICNLGACYEEGVGTDANIQKAFEFFHKAANLGYDLAQYDVAWMYENGNGVNKNIDQAIYWYEKSAKQGYQTAQEKLKELTEK
ncbi:hypothetical protein RclHR1_01080019 [Rhizophagus clarus]|uniref:Kinase-like domain-containing protein n=1 Tax=Rhizophagus clarus TaxID=94130 RepID=A0A2Z6Q2I3_9GLOM|nr:hypothetical protein RclHR1_01080019 [Rhizophagus clarus]GES90978.1 kinase-like domain-containing protein [Rhizophagus clarus]